jgi:predicted RNA-binding Zn-ribbon protein involved in translation (DUF1610 family)
MRTNVDYAAASTGRTGKRKRLILLGAICIALGGAVIYNYWSATRYDVKPRTRTLSDFYVTWRCVACGHELQDRGAVGPRTCPHCGKDEMYVCIRHACPVHGVFPVAFQYDDQQNPIRLKIADGDWVPYADDELNVNARCPRCGEFMMPAERARPAPPTEPPDQP